MVLIGDNAVISRIEANCYPPNTPDNADFELFIGPRHEDGRSKIFWFYLAKKTPKLKAYFNNENLQDALIGEVMKVSPTRAAIELGLADKADAVNVLADFLLEGA
jgi:hypothetical protein